MKNRYQFFEKAKKLSQEERNKYLTIGIEFRDELLVEMALQVGAEVNTSNSGLYPIERVCKNGCSEEILDLLLQGNTDVTVNNNSALRYAISRRHITLIKPLIKAGSDVSLDNNSAIKLALSCLDDNLIHFLLKHNADPNSCFEELCKSIKDIELRTIQYFIEYRLDLALYGKELLQHSSRSNRLDIIELIDSKIDISQYVNDLLTTAVRAGNSEIVQFYTSKCSVLSENLILIAVKRGYTETVRILINAGADVTIQDNSPICLATAYGYTAISNLLLKAGADPAARDNEPIQNAHKNKHFELEKLLLSYGADFLDAI